MGICDRRILGEITHSKFVSLGSILNLNPCIICETKMQGTIMALPSLRSSTIGYILEVSEPHHHIGPTAAPMWQKLRADISPQGS